VIYIRAWQQGPVAARAKQWATGQSLAAYSHLALPLLLTRGLKENGKILQKYQTSEL